MTEPILHVMPMPMDADAPIGIFDSGIGGLSVLRHVRAALPQEHLRYFADTAYAPYGDKDERQIIERSLAVAGFLVEEGVKALVVACNTATAASIQAIRLAWPDLVVVGIEPGLKPAAALSRTGIVGVLATRSTLASARFIALRAQIAAANEVQFVSQACVGLADQIEKAELHSPATALLVERYVAPLIAQGADTLVLGCTHYPFVRDLIASSARPAGVDAILVDTGEAVTRQLVRLLEARRLRRRQATAGVLLAYTTASVSTLSTTFWNLLQLTPEVRHMTGKTSMAST